MLQTRVNRSTALDPHTQPPQEPVLNNLPWVIAAFAIVMIGLELVFQIGGVNALAGQTGIGWRITGIQWFGLHDQVVDLMVAQRDFDPAFLTRFVTFSFVHGHWMDTLFAAALTLAIGKFVGEVFTNFGLFLLFALSAAFGAVCYFYVVDGGGWLISGFPGAYGLIGGYTYLNWVMLDFQGQNRLKAFGLIGILLLYQLIFGALFGTDTRWVAHIAAFVFGLGVSPLLAPGGLRMLRHALRRN
jgi:membrane associated rhomboid family serine protease